MGQLSWRSDVVPTMRPGPGHPAQCRELAHLSDSPKPGMSCALTVAPSAEARRGPTPSHECSAEPNPCRQWTRRSEGGELAPGWKLVTCRRERRKGTSEVPPFNSRTHSSSLRCRACTGSWGRALLLGAAEASCLCVCTHAAQIGHGGSRVTDPARIAPSHLVLPFEEHRPGAGQAGPRQGCHARAEPQAHNLGGCQGIHRAAHAERDAGAGCKVCAREARLEVQGIVAVGVG